MAAKLPVAKRRCQHTHSALSRSKWNGFATKQKPIDGRAVSETDGLPKTANELDCVAGIAAV